MGEPDWMAVNRANWDERVAVHLAALQMPDRGFGWAVSMAGYTLAAAVLFAAGDPGGLISAAGNRPSRSDRDGPDETATSDARR